MDGNRQDIGIDRAAAPALAREVPLMALWVRQVRAWIGALGYRPERRYMRGPSKSAAAVTQG